MARFQASDTMPKLGHVTEVREQWLVRTDGALAHRLQDREISSHLCENRCRNQQIREDFPVALGEQQGLEREARRREAERARQAHQDADIARELAEINLRRQRRRRSDLLPEPPAPAPAPVLSLLPAPAPAPHPPSELDPQQLGLTPAELEEMRRRLEQEERDARLARELSSEVQDRDILLADMRCAVEAQDNELARLLQEREYKKLQKAKEKARQKALLKKQQRMTAQQIERETDSVMNRTTLCDAYSNPKDLINENRLRLCKSVDSDLNYVEPFEKETIQSRSSALQSLDVSREYYPQHSEAGTSSSVGHVHLRPMQSDIRVNVIQHRQPPPPPTTGKKPRFPDPVSIRPASHYPTDEPHELGIPHSYSENNNLYGSTFPEDNGPSDLRIDRADPSKRLSVISDITAEGLAKKKSKAEMKKRKGCKIQ